MGERLESGTDSIGRVPVESSIPEQRTSFIENRIIRKIRGRDVRATVIVHPDGTSVFDHQPDKVVLHDAVLQRTDKGPRRFRDYPYDLWLTKRELFVENEDAIGNCQWLVRAQAIGYHYNNGIGCRIPKESSVNKKEDETVFYVSHSSSPYDPGRVYTQLLRPGTPEFVQAERQYQKVNQDREHMNRMKGIEQAVRDYRIRSYMEMLQGDIPLSA